MKILVVIGTRPEAIKMMPVVAELKKHPAQFETRVCVTAQHREMLDQVLTLFDIRPDYDLNIMQYNQSLTTLTANVLTLLEPIVIQEKPDWMLVQGDTTTTMAAALVAFYHRVKVGHVEAGLRTWNKFHPFPEEINRLITDDVSDLHFAPTEWARQNILREGIHDASIRVTGNTVIDALRYVGERPLLPEVSELLEQLGMRENRRLILVTAHRRENFGEPLENICKALREIAARYADVQIVYPVHLNPNVQQVAHKWLDGVERITLLKPLEYVPLVQLMKRAFLVLTDSGGIQEEAPAFGVPVLVMRETTERPEAVAAGTAKLVGTDTARIVTTVQSLLENTKEYTTMAHAANPFGDGHASERIVQAIME